MGKRKGGTTVNINILLRDTIIHMILNLGIFGLLVQYEFELTSYTFTLLLGLNLFLVTTLTGISSKKIGGNPQINGWTVGAISYTVLLLFLARYVDFSLEVNAFLFAFWSLVGFLGGLAGGIIGKPFKNLKTKEKLA